MPKWMDEFLAAVYPEMTDLATTTAHSEQQILTDATKRIRELEAALSKALAKTQCRKPQQRYDKRARPIVGWFDCGECDTCLARKELAVAKGEKAKP